MEEKVKPLPLEGIKVVELAAVVAAPTAGRLLSDFGAEVIKIETPGMGDNLRRVGDMNWMPVEEDNNPLFDLYNAGKKLTAINLKSDSGREILFKLLEDADVFISNTRMKSLEKMGLGYDSLSERFPKLIYAHFSGFGLQGPEKNRPGYDTTAFWMRTGAVLDMVPDGALPARATYAFGDIATASYFLNGILMALIGREKTGKGTLVETSLYNSGIWMNAPFVINSQPQYGNKLPYDRYEPWSPFNDCFLCKDGVWIAPLAKNYPKELEYLSNLFGLPELVEDPDYATIGRMKETGKEAKLMKHLEDIMLTKTSLEWKEIFEQADLPYEIIRHIRDIREDEQAWANGYLENIEYPEGISSVPVPPIKLSEYGRREFKKAPGIGGNTHDILISLGYSETEITKLREEKAIE